MTVAIISAETEHVLNPVSQTMTLPVLLIDSKIKLKSIGFIEHKSMISTSIFLDSEII